METGMYLRITRIRRVLLTLYVLAGIFALPEYSYAASKLQITLEPSRRWVTPAQELWIGTQIWDSEGKSISIATSTLIVRNDKGQEILKSVDPFCEQGGRLIRNGNQSSNCTSMSLRADLKNLAVGNYELEWNLN